jgi:hypothetical protein
VSVQFAYAGKSYEIDLNKRNAKKFDDLFDKAREKHTRKDGEDSEG